MVVEVVAVQLHGVDLVREDLQQVAALLPNRLKVHYERFVGLLQLKELAERYLVILEDLSWLLEVDVAVNSLEDLLDLVDSEAPLLVED